MWSPTAVEQGLVRPTIEPHSQTTATTTQRAVHRLPPPPRLIPPTTGIPALMSLAPTFGPTSSVTSTSTTRTRDTTASTGPSAGSSSQRESQGHGQIRLQGSTQVGSSQAGVQQSSQRRRHAQSQGCSQSQTHPLPESQSQRWTQTTTTSEGDRQVHGPQLTLPPPLRWPSRPPHRDRLTKKCLWIPLRCTLREEPSSLSSGGTLILLTMKALTCPKTRAGRQITSPSSTTFSEGTTLTYPQPSSGRSSNQSSDTWGLAGSSGPDSKRRTPCG